jgi:putative MATE family efflux protein
MNQKEREQQLSTMPIPRLVIRYSVPAIIGMLVNATYNVVDRYWIGKLNNVDAMSGIGLTMPMSTIILGFMLLVGVGTTACLSIRLGQQRHEEAARLLGNGFSLSILIGLALTLIGHLALEPILMAFGASPATIPYARDYARIILYGTTFSSIGFAMNHTIRGTGNPRRSASTQLLGAILNMILDPIFIFAFGLGVKGAAIATVISQIVSMIWVMSYYAGKSSQIRLRVANMVLQWKSVRDIMAIGASPFLLQIAASGITVLANRALRDTGGDIAIGAMTVISSVAILFLMPIFGINQGMQPILGFNYGARQYDRVRQTLFFGVKLASMIVVFGFLVVQLFPATIIRLFINDPDLIRVGTFGIRVFLSMLPLLGFQIVATNYFQSVGKAKLAIFGSMLRQVIILLPLYLILPRLFGLPGVWFASPIADFLSFVIALLMIGFEMRKLPKTVHSDARPAEPEITAG